MENPVLKNPVIEILYPAIGPDNNISGKKNSLSSVFMLELDSIAVPVFAVWLNLTNTVSE